MAAIKIYAKDYANLVENFSEKNIINKVTGKEYLMTTAENTIELNTTIINPNTRSIIFKAMPYNNGNATETGNTEDQSYRRGILEVPVGNIGIITLKAYVRAEGQYIEGSYEFDTDESTINRNTKLSCNLNIRYTESDGDEITANTYNRAYKTAFFSEHTFPFKIEADGTINSGKDGYFRVSNDDDTIVHSETTNFLKDGYSEEIIYVNEKYNDRLLLDVPGKNQYCRAKIKQVIGENIIDENGNTTKAEKTTILVEYGFLIWEGYHYTDTSVAFPKSGKVRKVLCVDDITITTVADTFTATPVDFEFKTNYKGRERKYELETNELFQFYESNSAGSRLNLSYKIANTILENYNTDRRIVTFDLLNTTKYEIDDTDKYDIYGATNESRYLDVDDEFDLYGEHGEFNGIFKVLKANGIWDGVYYKKITAILISGNK